MTELTNAITFEARPLNHYFLTRRLHGSLEQDVVNFVKSRLNVTAVAVDLVDIHDITTADRLTLMKRENVKYLFMVTGYDLENASLQLDQFIEDFEEYAQQK